MKKGFGNSGKEKFLDLYRDRKSLDDPTDRLTEGCKFNFAYFDVQSAGQDFSDLDQQKLGKILNKLKDYSKESLEHWKKQPIGKNGTVFSNYGAFPKKSDFTQPKHIPHQVEWGRFRLDWKFRLCGFIIPKSYDGKPHKITGKNFCSNTFYVVFLDENHCFYKTEDN